MLLLMWIDTGLKRGELHMLLRTLLFGTMLLGTMLLRTLLTLLQLNEGLLTGHREYIELYSVSPNINHWV